MFLFLIVLIAFGSRRKSPEMTLRLEKPARDDEGGVIEATSLGFGYISASYITIPRSYLLPLDSAFARSIPERGDVLEQFTAVPYILSCITNITII
ncbi:hypothetical protein F4809DRAFT_296302 [Biscogniauxia mediterranea]|nr:hypothetical protein F4809DRAFT_296302 [Biscogniauxia mediterranea]